MKPLNKMTKAEARVAIARDAIKQIKARKIIVSATKYLNILSSDEKVEKGFFKKDQTCQVCQIGQAIVCGINLFNHGHANENSNDYKQALELVTKWFPTKMAVMMEGAFMPSLGGWLTRDSHILSDEKFRAVRNFCGKYSNDTKRSIAIWENIISNKGKFIP